MVVSCHKKAHGGVGLSEEPRQGGNKSRTSGCIGRGVGQMFTEQKREQADYLTEWEQYASLPRQGMVGSSLHYVKRPKTATQLEGAWYPLESKWHSTV